MIALINNNEKIDKFRFYVFDEKDRRRSAVWTILINNDSAYVFSKKLGGIAKLSLHNESNDGRDSQFGFSYDFWIKTNIKDNASPKHFRWKRGVPEYGEIKSVASVVFPTDYLKGDFQPNNSDLQDEKRKFALPIAKDKKALYVEIFFIINSIDSVAEHLSSVGVTPLCYKEIVGSQKVLVAAREGMFDNKILPDFQNKVVKINGVNLPERGKEAENLNAIFLNYPKNMEQIFLIEVNGIKITGK